MRYRLLAVSAVALLLLTGCAPAPVPSPTPSASTSSPTPTPTVEPIVAPTPAFDVTCADVAAEVTPIVGEVEGGVSPGLQLWSASSWYPGPAQRMFERSGGVACSANAEGHRWEVAIVPGARAILDGTAARHGDASEGIRCEPGMGDSFGFCMFVVEAGDILLEGMMHGPQITAADTAKVEAAAQRLLDAAARTQREVVLGDSAIVGVPCTRFLTSEEASGLVGADTVLSEPFGGWSIQSEVYFVVNGAKICHYGADVNPEGDAPMHLMITSLPGGAWAFDEIEGATAVDIEGADAALASVDLYGRDVLDLRIGPDWLRLTKPESSAIGDLAPVATEVVENFTVGRPAPQ